jgi:hypothetical protein
MVRIEAKYPEHEVRLQLNRAVHVTNGHHPINNALTETVLDSMAAIHPSMNKGKKTTFGNRC